MAPAAAAVAEPLAPPDEDPPPICLAQCDATVWCAARGHGIARRDPASGARTADPLIAAARDVRCLCYVRGTTGAHRVWAGCAGGEVVAYSEAAPGELVAEHRHRGAVRCIITHGKRVYSCSDDGTVCEWSPDGMVMLRLLRMRKPEQEPSSPPRSGGVVWGLAGRGMALFACGGEAAIRALDLRNGSLVSELRGHTAAVRCVLVHQGALWSCGDDCSVRVWDAAHSSCAAVLDRHQGAVRCLAHAGTLVASAGDDGLLCLWRPGADPHGASACLELGAGRAVRQLAAVAPHGGGPLQLWAAEHASSCSKGLLRWALPTAEAEAPAGNGSSPATGYAAEAAELRALLRQREEQLAASQDVFWRLELEIQGLRRDVQLREEIFTDELSRRDVARAVGAGFSAGADTGREQTTEEWLRRQLSDTISACSSLRARLAEADTALARQRQQCEQLTRAATHHVRSCGEVLQRAMRGGAVASVPQPQREQLQAALADALQHVRISKQRFEKLVEDTAAGRGGELCGTTPPSSRQRADHRIARARLFRERAAAEGDSAGRCTPPRSACTSQAESPRRVLRPRSVSAGRCYSRSRHSSATQPPASARAPPAVQGPVLPFRSGCPPLLCSRTPGERWSPAASTGAGSQPVRGSPPSPEPEEQWFLNSSVATIAAHRRQSDATVKEEPSHPIQSTPADHPLPAPLGTPTARVPLSRTQQDLEAELAHLGIGRTMVDAPLAGSNPMVLSHKEIMERYGSTCGGHSDAASELTEMLPHASGDPFDGGATEPPSRRMSLEAARRGSFRSSNAALLHQRRPSVRSTGSDDPFAAAMAQLQGLQARVADLDAD